jgi:UDP-glucose 4-epimerase
MGGSGNVRALTNNVQGLVNLTNKKILVTGADGFIGSHLVEALLNEGCNVKAFVYYNSFNSWGWLDSISEKNYLKLKYLQVTLETQME